MKLVTRIMVNHSENLYSYLIPDLVSLLLLIQYSLAYFSALLKISTLLSFHATLALMASLARLALFSAWRLTLATLQDRLWAGRQFVRHFDF